MRKEHFLHARNRNPFIIMFHSATTDLEDKKERKRTIVGSLKVAILY